MEMLHALSSDLLLNLGQLSSLDQPFALSVGLPLQATVRAEPHFLEVLPLVEP